MVDCDAVVGLGSVAVLTGRRVAVDVRTVLAVDDPADAVTARLRRALGVSDDAPAGSADEATRREREDAAVALWAAATTNYDHAVHERERVIHRLTVAVSHAMRPLQRSYYERIEACLAAEDWTALARFDGRNIARVAATRQVVEAARTRLAAAAAGADAAVESARGARRAATENLISILGLGRAADITGMGRRRLSAVRADRQRELPRAARKKHQDAHNDRGSAAPLRRRRR